MATWKDVLDRLLESESQATRDSIYASATQTVASKGANVQGKECEMQKWVHELETKINELEKETVRLFLCKKMTEDLIRKKIFKP